jgi:hypothetical protein
MQKLLLHEKAKLFVLGSYFGTGQRSEPFINKQSFTGKGKEYSDQHSQIENYFDELAEDFSHVSTSRVNCGAPVSMFRCTRS